LSVAEIRVETQLLPQSTRRLCDDPRHHRPQLGADAEQAMLMGGACAKAYGWSPKKG